MSNPQTPPQPGADGADKAEKKAPAKAMTAADAAKRVKRTVEVKEGGKAVVKTLPVKAEEVLDFKDYGTHVVVVTVDGQKLSSAEAEA